MIRLKFASFFIFVVLVSPMVSAAPEDPHMWYTESYTNGQLVGWCDQSCYGRYCDGSGGEEWVIWDLGSCALPQLEPRPCYTIDGHLDPCPFEPAPCPSGQTDTRGRCCKYGVTFNGWDWQCIVPPPPPPNCPSPNDPCYP